MKVLEECRNSLKEPTKCPKCGYKQYCPCSSCKSRLPEGMKPWEWIDGELMKCSCCGYTLHCDGWLDIKGNEHRLIEALTSTISLIQDYQKLREKLTVENIDTEISVVFADYALNGQGSRNLTNDLSQQIVTYLGGEK